MVEDGMAILLCATGGGRRLTIRPSPPAAQDRRHRAGTAVCRPTPARPMSASGSNPMICTALDQCHSAGTCDSSSGICSNSQKADGTPCSGGTCCRGSGCPAGEFCCDGGGANGGCCDKPCCGSICCAFSNSKCCSGDCYIGPNPSARRFGCRRIAPAHKTGCAEPRR